MLVAVSRASRTEGIAQIFFYSPSICFYFPPFPTNEASLNYALKGMKPLDVYVRELCNTSESAGT